MMISEWMRARRTLKAMERIATALERLVELTTAQGTKAQGMGGWSNGDDRDDGVGVSYATDENSWQHEQERTKRHAEFDEEG
jgi:hypothetical protein